MTHIDQKILYLLLGGFIVLQLYWILTDPRSMKDRLTFYFGLRKKSKMHRYIMILAIVFIFVLSFFPRFTTPLLQLTHTSYDSLFIFLGSMIYLFGFIIAMWARIIMQEKWLPAGDGHNPKRQNELFVRGAFQFTRNPIYVGLLALYIGFFIALRSPLVLLALLPGVFFYHSAVNEEGYLEKQFGKKYLEYKNKVPRFLLK